MGYLKITSSEAPMLTNVTALSRAGEAALRARRLSPPPANGKAHLPRADQLALAEIAQRFAPGSQAAAPAAADQRFETRPPQPQTQATQNSAAVASPRGTRTLIGVLILVALLPSALFGAMIWLGAIHLTWPTPWPKAQATTWAAAAPASVAGAITAGEPQPIPVKTLALTSPPQEEHGAGAALAEPVHEAAKEPEITAWISPDEDRAATPELPYDTNLIGVVSWDAQRQGLLGATGVEEVFTAPEETLPPPEHLLQAPEARDEDAKDDGKTWITAPQFVNLRKGPTSSAAVISIVAKGAKLEVLGRKRGWVQVASPETSENGWIYTGSKARRKAKPASEETAEGGLLSNLGGWLGGSSD